MWVLAGDIGGTNTRLQLAEVKDQEITYHTRISYPSQEYDHLIPVVKKFLQQVANEVSIESACFAVAGPVRAKTAQVTNLPWFLDSQQLQTALEIPIVHLINDFQAIGYGVPLLEEKDLLTLQLGKPELHGRKGLIGAGTGLGEALLVWQTNHYEPCGTEGGHVDFAPVNDLQMELLAYLKKDHPHVSYEMLLSGSGLIRIYSFLRDVKNMPESNELKQHMLETDPAAVISEWALADRDLLAVQSLDCFISIYAAQAGNVALNFLATGGMYIAGGIAPKIISKLKPETFLPVFHNKGKMSALMHDIPVKVVLNEEVGLLGAVQKAVMNIQ